MFAWESVLPSASALRIYLATPSTLEGGVLPLVISGILLWHYGPKVKDRRLVLGFFFAVLTFGVWWQRWGAIGLHVFSGSVIFWPVMVLLQGNHLPWPVVYPLAFLSTCIPDLYGAGTAANWSCHWFFGVGGAGLRDGLFVIPLEAMVFSAILNSLGNWIRKHGLFDRGSAREISNYAETAERRAGRNC
jgi:hypothetical protein